MKRPPIDHAAAAWRHVRHGKDWLRPAKEAVRPTRDEQAQRQALIESFICENGVKS